MNLYIWLDSEVEAKQHWQFPLTHRNAFFLTVIGEMYAHIWEQIRNICLLICGYAS